MVKLRLECQTCETVIEDEYDGVFLIVMKGKKKGLIHHEISTFDILQGFGDYLGDLKTEEVQGDDGS